MEDNNMIWFIVFSGLVASMVIAFTKNRNPIGWALAGFLLPLVGVIAIVCLPPRPLGTTDVY
jgi:hypothetical protein